MKFRLLMTALVLSLALPAAAQFTTVQLAHEVEMSTVRLPQSESGTIAFKACGECDYQTTRVSSETVWLVNNRPVTLVKFRQVVAGMTDRDKEYVTVKQHLERDLITQVSIIVR
ncbi:MAG: hypothetical protein OER97_09130 [Gammaproteobacteria bacterium]|nr:hypothetical protein [Gammaproteobacteria bacterium]